MRRISAVFAILGLLAISSCQSAPLEPVPSPAPAIEIPSLAPIPSLTPPAPRATPTAPPTPLPTSTPSISPISSPLGGVSLADLSQIISNPFDPPLPGRDDGHHGTDFAFYRWGERIGMSGNPVLSVFDGQIAMVVANRPPYGNAVIVETAWDALTADVRGLLDEPLPPTPLPASIRLSCPGFLSFPGSAAGHPSLYLLYAHLKETPDLRIGERLTSGQSFGLVGTTGNSVNPHLHLETRAGPPGATIPAMAHYITSATQQEMEGYCTWRVSGTFAMLDPVKVLNAAQER